MSAALDRCTAALGDKNVQAFLHCIGAGESGEALTELDYRVINGGSHFDAPPWKHPYYGIPTTRGAKASGAFQFLGTTFQRCDEALGLGGDFSPTSQNVAAVYLMASRGALSAVLRGDLVTACHKLAEEWVSLPALMASGRVQAIFAKYGGTRAAQDGAGAAISPSSIPTPQPDAPTAPRPELPSYQPEFKMPAILAQLLPMVLGMFSQGGQAQLQPITSRPADQIGPFLLNLFSQIAGSTGVIPAGQTVKTDAEAVAAVAELQKLRTTNAALVADIEKRALSYLADMAPLFDKLAAADKAENEARIAGTNAAAERAQKERWDMTPWLVWIAGGTATVLVLALLGAIIWQATTGERSIDTALIGLAGPLLAIAMGVWREIFSYRFDGSPSSAASNAITQQIAVASKRV